MTIRQFDDAVAGGLMSAALAALEAVQPTFPSTSRYRLGRAIADGKTGPAYLGFQRGVVGFERLVVVRRAPEHPRDMLLAELARTSGLRHPNVVGVDDIEEHDGDLFLVSEYVEGASLADLAELADDRRVPAPVALRIALDVCAALEAIHDAGFVHRGVSRENVFVGSDGMTRLTDFGIPDEASARTSRRPRAVPMESDDVLAFAVMLWETLAGRRLTKPAGKAPAVSSIAGDVPPLLDAAVSKALGVWPLERFASIKEARIVLEGAAHGFMATHEEVGELVSSLAREAIEEQRSEIRAKAFVAEDSEEEAERTGRFTRPAIASQTEIVVAPPPAAPPVAARSLASDLAKLGLALFLVAALCLTTAFACGAFFH